MLSAETPSTRYDFTYYENGLRKTKQCVQGYQSYEYIYDGTTLVTENFIGLYTLVYIYDVNGAPIGFKYRANNYATDTWDVFWYEKNLLGDIVAVYSATGTKLVSYDYDAWGNFTTTYHNGGASTGAMYNKFTYRGYYYDSDLGMYYLQSRYYDPMIGRFINADIPDVITATPTALTDKNLYAYCDNNPVMRSDEDGEFWHIIAGAVVGGVVSGIINTLEQLSENGEVNLQKVLVSTAAGALSGALATVGAAPVVGALIQFTGNAIISAGENILTQGIDNGGLKNLDVSQVISDALIGGFTNMGNGLSKGVSKHLMTQGKQATKQIAKKGLRKAAKYYFSQTATMFYKPLIKDAFSDIMKTSIEKHKSAKYSFFIR